MGNAKYLALTLLAVLMVTGFAWGQGEVGEKSAMPGRFQLVAATVQSQSSLNGPVSAEQNLFMVDTVTGKVWHYVPSGPFLTPKGNPGFTPDMFVRVLPVEGLEGTVSEQMQKTIEYFDKNPATPIKTKH